MEHTLFHEIAFGNHFTLGLPVHQKTNTTNGIKDSDLRMTFDIALECLR